MHIMISPMCCKVHYFAREVNVVASRHKITDYYRRGGITVEVCEWFIIEEKVIFCSMIGNFSKTRNEGAKRKVDNPANALKSMNPRLQLLSMHEWCTLTEAKNKPGGARPANYEP